MSTYCIWEDCDQVGLYCAGHALEFANVANENEAIKLRHEKAALLSFINRVATESSDPVAKLAAESVLAEYGRVPVKGLPIVHST